MKSADESGGTYPSTRKEFFSFIYFTVKTSLTSKANGFINLFQTIYLMQWAHAIFRMYDEYPGLILTEKHLFYLKAEKYQREGNLAELERLCEDSRVFSEKAKYQKLWQPSHPKMLSSLYRILGNVYVENQQVSKAIGILEDAERVLLILIKDYPSYNKAKILLNDVQKDIKQLYS